MLLMRPDIIWFFISKFEQTFINRSRFCSILFPVDRVYGLQDSIDSVFIISWSNYSSEAAAPEVILSLPANLILKNWWNARLNIETSYYNKVSGILRTLKSLAKD